MMVVVSEKPRQEFGYAVRRYLVCNGVEMGPVRKDRGAKIEPRGRLGLYISVFDL